MIEREVKLPLSDPDALRARLAALGSPRVAFFREENRFFDLPGDPLRAAGSALRLRTETPLPAPGADAGGVGGAEGAGGPARHYLTFKGPRVPAAAGVKAREEVEADVADPGDAAALLRALGHRLRFVFEKRRERHRLGPCVVELDELPGLGFFVEVEGPGEAEIEAALRRLGLEGAPRCPEGYLSLLVAGGRDAVGAEGGPAFRFDGPR